MTDRYKFDLKVQYLATIRGGDSNENFKTQIHCKQALEISAKICIKLEESLIDD